MPVLGPLLTQVPPRLGSTSFGDLVEQAQLAWKVRKLGVRGIADLTRLFLMSITDLLDEWFESDELKAIIAAVGVIGAWSGPDGPGTAFVLIHNAISDVGDGEVNSWGYPQGGMGAVSDAIRSSAESAGCVVRTNARVAKIMTQGDRVVGAVLDSGEEFRAPVVVSDSHTRRYPHHLAESAVPHAPSARLRRLPDPDSRPLQRIERHPRGRWCEWHPGPPGISPGETRRGASQAMGLEGWRQSQLYQTLNETSSRAVLALLGG